MNARVCFRVLGFIGFRVLGFRGDRASVLGLRD